MNRILLLEDDPGLTEGLSYALSKNGFFPDIAGSVQEARSLLFPIHSYDLLLLDVTLPDGTGFGLCSEIRGRGDQTPIIFLTASDEETIVIRGLDSGGDDYITKPFKLGELCSRIRALLRRSTLTNQPEGRYSSMRLGSGPVQVDCTSGKAYLNGTPLGLTGMEYRLICLFLRNPSRILTRGQILDELWDGNGNFVDDNTLSVYIRRLREKIEENPSQPEHLLTIRGMGYRWEEDSHASSV